MDILKILRSLYTSFPKFGVHQAKEMKILQNSKVKNVFKKKLYIFLNLLNEHQSSIWSNEQHCHINIMYYAR